MNHDQIERAFGAFLYRKGEGDTDREAFFKALDLTSEGEAVEGFPQPDTTRAGKEPCGECHIQLGETCDICGASNPAPQPAQPDLEVVGYVRRDPNDTIPHEAAFQFSERTPGGFDDEGWRAVGFVDDAQAHIAALTAKVLESEKLRGQRDAAMAKVEELTRERDGALEADERHAIAWRDAERRAETAEARIADLEKERDGLREALEPFAAYGRLALSGTRKDTELLGYAGPLGEVSIHAHHFAKAAALHPISSQEEAPPQVD